VLSEFICQRLLVFWRGPSSKKERTVSFSQVSPSDMKFSIHTYCTNLHAFSLSSEYNILSQSFKNRNRFQIERTNNNKQTTNVQFQFQLSGVVWSPSIALQVHRYGQYLILPTRITPLYTNYKLQNEKQTLATLRVHIKQNRNNHQKEWKRQVNTSHRISSSGTAK